MVIFCLGSSLKITSGSYLNTQFAAASLLPSLILSFPLPSSSTLLSFFLFFLSSPSPPPPHPLSLPPPFFIFFFQRIEQRLIFSCLVPEIIISHHSCKKCQKSQKLVIFDLLWGLSLYHVQSVGGIGKPGGQGFCPSLSDSITVARFLWDFCHRFCKEKMIYLSLGKVWKLLMQIRPLIYQ